MRHLASDDEAIQGSQTPTGGAISAWQSEPMEDLLTCVRDVLQGCWYRCLDTEVTAQPDLPDRFRTPDGTLIYTDSLILAEQTDRTLFGTSITPVGTIQP